jgi:hypothetical protein
VQAALEPLLPQFEKLFAKADAEDMLRKHGHEHLIDKHSVHNALQGWLAEKPQRHIKRVRAPDKQKTLGYEVLEEAKNQGRKAAKRAARTAHPPVEQQHPLLGAPDPVTFDPASIPVTGRNSAYAEQMLRANGHANGHAAEGKRPPADEPSPPAEPSCAPAAPPPAPAVALAAQQRADILTLLASGMAETTEADLKEFEEAETMMLEGMDRMRRVVKKTGGFLSFRARAVQLFGAVTP